MTGKPGVLQSMGWQRVGHNLVTEQPPAPPCIPCPSLCPESWPLCTSLPGSLAVSLLPGGTSRRRELWSIFLNSLALCCGNSGWTRSLRDGSPFACSQLSLDSNHPPSPPCSSRPRSGNDLSQKLSPGSKYHPLALTTSLKYCIKSLPTPAEGTFCFLSVSCLKHHLSRLILNPTPPRNLLFHCS